MKSWAFYFCIPRTVLPNGWWSIIMETLIITLLITTTPIWLRFLLIWLRTPLSTQVRAGSKASISSAGSSSLSWPYTWLYASLAPENADRYIPVNVLLELEREATVPFVTKALSELQGMSLEYDETRGDPTGALNSDVIKLSQRFATLMGEYNQSIEDGIISHFISRNSN